MDQPAVTEMWAQRAKTFAARFWGDVATSFWIGAPIPARVNWQMLHPPCCANRSFSGGPSPTNPHADHCWEAALPNESVEDCAIRLGKEGGYEVPMHPAIEGQPGWEERARAEQERKTA